MLGKLTLANGTVLTGESFGANTSASGEVVFNTGMVGYPESLTDPSYFGQILVLTYPLIGSYGVPPKKFFESKKIQIRGLIVQNYINHPSHFESRQTLDNWLKKEGVSALSGVDTRSLTTMLRSHGTMLGKIEVNSKTKFYNPNQENLLPSVSCKKVKKHIRGKKRIVLIDCGAKENILRSLLARGVSVLRVPWDHTLTNLQFNGVVISNGPGDPQAASKTISTVKRLLRESAPVFGICLGNQILALAAGAKTYKLKFGHRSQNQPVLNLRTKNALITSQNHGFAVDAKTLPSGWEEWFVNLNDGTNEGIRHKKKPFFSVQFHPEASPGPTDANYLFDEFLSYV